MLKKPSGLIILLSLMLGAWSQAPGQSRKAQELIYDDLQLLKKQLLALEEKLDKTTDEVRALKEQLRDLQAQVKLLAEGDVEKNVAQAHAEKQLGRDVRQLGGE
jgi:predicted nuclease with TOPRIM domain